MAVVVEAGWRGVSNQGKWDNHESNLSEDEIKALAESIINIPGFKAPVPETAQCFKDLSNALQNGTVTVTKGIHQRDSKVHFDVKSSIGATGTFHVFVKAGDTSAVPSSPVVGGWGIAKDMIGKTVTRNLFAYVVSGLSYRVGGMDYLFPTAFVALTDLEKPLGRERRNSLCVGNSQAAPSRSEMLTLA